MAKTIKDALKLIDGIAAAETAEYSEAARDEAQRLLLSRYLALLDAGRRLSSRERGRQAARPFWAKA